MNKFDNLTQLNSQRGFTLIEIMIAMTIFAIGILAVNIMQTSSIKGNYDANLISGRTNWAVDRIEKIAGLDYSDGNITDDGNSTSIDGSATSPDGVYTITWTVADNTPIQGTKTLVITVTDTLQAKESKFAYIKAEVL